MTELQTIAFRRTYHATQEEYTRFRKAGYLAIADKIVDSLADMEDIWISHNLPIESLIYVDPYEQLVQEIEELPPDTYTDYMEFIAHDMVCS